MRFIDHLIDSIYRAAVHNRICETAPACILWPDQEKQWQGVIDIQQKEIPEIFILGDYKPEERTGPAIWLRCVLANSINGISIPPGHIPIIYLPGFSSLELKPVDTCPEEIKILCSYQYLGVVWSQITSKDWTAFDLLKSNQGGLALTVSEDDETHNALRISLRTLLYTLVSSLQNRQLNADFFYSLLSKDTDRSFLEWFDRGEDFKKQTEANSWKAITAKVKEKYSFDIETEGLLSAVENFADRKGQWRSLWERFCESPKRYPNIPSRIRKCQLPQTGDDFDGWPQWNENKEKLLRNELLSLSGTTADSAREKILNLEDEHKKRRNLVWKELGESPLAVSLEYLAILARLTQQGLNGGTLEDIVKGYEAYGYKADEAVLKSLENLEGHQAYQAVAAAINAIYKPWLEDNALYFQSLVQKENSVRAALKNNRSFDYVDGDCILFVDGLRYDVARRLLGMLESSGCTHTTDPVWAALPTITATGKPAVFPCAGKISGTNINSEFVPYFKETDTKADSVHLRKSLAAAGWIFLEKTDSGKGSGLAWCEEGNIDHEGHNQGGKFVKSIANILLEIKERIASLFAAGWKRVFIVSDHGWLFLPGGLPLDAKLPVDLTEAKWGRCALAKEGAIVDQKQYPWFWNPNRFFIAANGINVFYNGYEYAHGGISIQECLLLRICVTPQAAASGKITIKNARWQGLGCQIALGFGGEGLQADIRTQPENPTSSIAWKQKPKMFKPDGTVKINVPDEDMEGKEAYIVIFDEAGTIFTQKRTVIGSADDGQLELL
jgi:hypothetical protein